MRPGKVVTIRINPKDCMSILDVLGVTNQMIKGASFPALASLALSALLETVRKNGAIPTRDGFEYNDMMAPYIGTRRDGVKLAVADTIHRAGSEMRIASVPQEPTEALADATTEVTPEVMRARRRLAELMDKKDLADERSSGVIWMDSDEQEYQQMYKIVYPHG